MTEIVKEQIAGTDEVLAMYDVRGIQNYIFRTNRVKEIMGGSVIVDNIIVDGLKQIIQGISDGDEQISKNYLTEWKTSNNSLEFLSNKDIQMQVMYIGGGNAYVLYRSYDLCRKFNRELAEYVFKETYALQLAVATVKKTNSYYDDYGRIKMEMRRVKSVMPDGRPVGAFPFMKVDPVTGFPIIDYSSNDGYLSTESQKKCLAYKENVKEDLEKAFDNLISKKNDNSMLAVVHIDGNNMGLRISQIMRAIDEESKNDYEKVTQVVRGISRSIDKSFSEAFMDMEKYIKNVLSLKVKQEIPCALYRKIICAGDDITFVCNAKVALAAVIHFLEFIGKRKMEVGGLTAEEPFSACAGIAYFHSHFPFSDAYQVAEECCSSAKKRAKETARTGAHGEVGSFLDYQICGTISAADLQNYRKKHYSVHESEQTSLVIQRPYYVSASEEDPLNVLNKDRNVNILTGLIKDFSDSSKLSRSKAKLLREAASKGSDEMNACKTFLISRDHILPDPTTEPYWYDALEIADLVVLE